MSSPIGDMPARSFQSRINRVADVRAPYEEGKSEVSVLPDWKRDVAGKSGVPVAITVSVLMVVLVRVVKFHTTGVAMISDTPDITMATEVGAALLLSLLIFVRLPYAGVGYKLVQIVGVFGAITLMHNAVHYSPSISSLIFSQQWVEKVIAETEPNSVYFRGETTVITLPEQAESKEKVLPKVLRLN